MKESVREKLKTANKNRAKQELENNILETICNNTEIDIPEEMIETQIENMLRDFDMQMRYQGIDLQQYMQYTGMTLESLQNQTKPQAEKSIRTRLVLEAVVKAENIQVSDEMVEEEIQKMADSYKMEVEKVKEYLGESEIKRMKEDLAVQEAVDFLVAEAKLV